MAGNNVYVQGSYVDIHDNEVVNLSVDKGEVHVGDNGKAVVAESETMYEVKMLVECVDEVRPLFWGNSSYLLSDFSTAGSTVHYSFSGFSTAWSTVGI